MSSCVTPRCGSSNARERAQRCRDVIWQDDERLLQIAYATPFTQYRRAETAFPYGLRIFAPDSGSNQSNPENMQVLNVEWNARSGASRVINYPPAIGKARSRR